MIAASVLLLINITLFSVSLAKIIGGGSRLWLIPVIIFIVLFIISVMILVSVMTAGIDIKDGTVILPDLDPSKGKQPKFNIKALRDVQLRNGEGRVLDPGKDNLVGARIAFLLDDNSVELYYPVSITPRQFEKIRTGMLEGLPY